MKKIYNILLVLCIAAASNAQIVISEIMYNPPESGTDTLEYIELVNASNSPFSLNGLKITAGITFSFPDQVLASGQVFLIAKDSVLIKKLFNIDCRQFGKSGDALSNSGEGIVLSDAQGNVMDEVIYDDVAPWPLEADEGGASLILCDPKSDNAIGSNWIAALNKTGIVRAGKELKCSPGVGNDISCAVAPSVFIDVANFSFTPKDITINSGTTVRWTNKGGTHNVNGNTSIFPSNPASFSSGTPSSSAWTYDFTFIQEGKYEYQCDLHASSGMKGTVTVGNVKSYPAYSISTVTTVNQQGVVDSLNRTCTLTGKVYGINLRSGGLQFTLIDDQNNGIAVFNGASDLGYQVKEGDNISVKGSIAQFFGLAEIVPDAISVLSSGNTLVNAKKVTTLEEIDESSLIKLSNLTYIDVTEWKGDGTSFNVNVTDGSSTFVIRIDNDIDASKLTAPSAPFDLTGIVGQNDTQAPFDEGYQISPRYVKDFSTYLSTKHPNTATEVSAMPNPTNGFVYFKSENQINSIELYDANGRKLSSKINSNSIDISAYNSGIYIARIRQGINNQNIKLIKY